ncbi:sulfite exporter TauE/SafE family protein [Thalassovita mangrovi]|uniref:Probable membrane transporter protein n=1 Tax=Thalassovita mangrovi TaxID=2692236 RepID=A0A6L8LS10_9RHOB|nr:sulfite exporter TauE/SafE family protein [Thalassovita mangrovi]MYM55929.1 TSUP family transporter [Thalassovita mangrovi]
MSIEALFGGFEPLVLLALLATSFLGSFITVALGIGGGALLLTVMASLMPPAALIPVHGVIQFGSNVFRAALLFKHSYWPPFAAFALGTLFGAVLGGSVVVNLPPAAVQIGVGAFVIYSILSKPPAWLSRLPFVTGTISSFLTMFFGATGVFVANFTKSLQLQRERHVATHAGFMTIQHVLKVVVFGFLGFQFGPWIGFIAAMVFAGLLGTILGRRVLVRIGDKGFKRALDIVLVLVSLRLIWQGAGSFL